MSPPQAEAACVKANAKGVVRNLSMTVTKGVFRALGGADTATASSATFATTDRCDGTLTSVGKGRVSLAVKGRRRCPSILLYGQPHIKTKSSFDDIEGRRG